MRRYNERPAEWNFSRSSCWPVENELLCFKVRERLRVALERCSALEEQLTISHKEVSKHENLLKFFNKFGDVSFIYEGQVWLCSGIKCQCDFEVEEIKCKILLERLKENWKVTLNQLQGTDRLTDEKMKRWGVYLKRAQTLIYAAHNYQNRNHINALNSQIVYYKWILVLNITNSAVNSSFCRPWQFWPSESKSEEFSLDSEPLSSVQVHTGWLSVTM